MVNKGKITVKGCSAFLHFFPFSKWHDSGCIDIIHSLTWAHLLVPPEATMEMVTIRLYFQTKLCHICKLARVNNAVISIMSHSHCCQCLIKVKTTGGYMSSSLIFFPSLLTRGRGKTSRKSTDLPVISPYSQKQDKEKVEIGSLA